MLSLISKTCTKCKISKSLNEFNKDTGQVSGLRPECKICRNKIQDIRRKRLFKTDHKYRLKIQAYDRSRYIGKRKADHMKRMKLRTPDFIKNSFIKCKYGITLDDYNKMLEIQKGVCAICGEHETRKMKGTNKICKLHIDHDHKTGKVRSLLCHRCNSGLGNFKENIQYLKNSINYLEFHSKKEN